MQRMSKSGLLSILALAAYSFAGTPKISVTTDKDVYLRGDPISFTINLDAQDTGFEVTAFTTNQTLPQAVQLPLGGHDIFSSEGDTSGVYLDGIFQGRVVDPMNSITDISAMVLRGVPPFEGVFEPANKVVTYFSDIGQDADFGQHTVSVYDAVVTHRVGQGSYLDEPVASQDITPASFVVVPECRADFNKDGRVNNVDYQHLEGCLDGPDYLTRSGCEDADLNSNGSIGLDDAASFQTCFTGDQLVTDPDCHLR